MFDQCFIRGEEIFARRQESKALSAIGVEHRDVSYLAWAYEQDVPRTSFGWGHSAAIAPPLPWPNRESVVRRDNDIRRLWAERRESAAASKTP